MKLSQYQDLYRRLATAEDIDFLAENFGYDKELLLVIYTQRIVRDTTKKFYRVKAQAKRLAFLWQNGESLVSIARKFEFPPILGSLMILEQRKIPRKQFWKMIRDLDSVRDRRLRRELGEVVATDIVYSPVGSARQFARGGHLPQLHQDAGGRGDEAPVHEARLHHGLPQHQKRQRREDGEEPFAASLHGQDGSHLRPRPHSGQPRPRGK